MYSAAAVWFSCHAVSRLEYGGGGFHQGGLGTIILARKVYIFGALVYLPDSYGNFFNTYLGLCYIFVICRNSVHC